jgi:hypothetical protein
MQENNTTLYEVTTVEELITGEVETTVGEEVSRGDVGFTPDSLSWSLPIMGKGMLGIFIVTSIIVTVTVILNKATAPRKKNKEKKDK